MFLEKLDKFLKSHNLPEYFLGKSEKPDWQKNNELILQLALNASVKNGNSNFLHGWQAIVQWNDLKIVHFVLSFHRWKESWVINIKLLKLMWFISNI